MTPDLLDTIWKLAGIIFAAGMVWAELKAIRKDIKRLSDKVEQHNTFDRRIVRLETMLEIRGRNDTNE